MSSVSTESPSISCAVNQHVIFYLGLKGSFSSPLYSIA